MEDQETSRQGKIITNKRRENTKREGKIRYEPVRNIRDNKSISLHTQQDARRDKDDNKREDNRREEKLIKNNNNEYKIRQENQR